MCVNIPTINKNATLNRMWITFIRSDMLFASCYELSVCTDTMHNHEIIDIAMHPVRIKTRKRYMLKTCYLHNVNPLLGLFHLSTKN